MVWLVDDDPLIRSLAEKRSADAGIGIVLFAGGREMLDALPESEPFLLLVDNEMPKMNGITAGGEARAQGYAGPMVLWTASPNRDVIRRAAESGFDRVLSKAIPLEQILVDVGLAA